MRGLIIIVIVVVALVGGLLTLRSSRSAGMPDKDVIDRAKQREREQAAKDDQES
ncbi:MAG: DUF2897 family protein [Steroidobacteraceae bacterium]